VALVPAGLAAGLGDGLAAAVDGVLPLHAAPSSAAAAAAAVNRNLDRMHPDTRPGYV
jgi:hypothetical protein